MCDNPTLNLNFFESRNTLVIEELLDITDEIAGTIKQDGYMWVNGQSNRAHGGFVKRLDNNNKVDNYKAYILPNVSKLQFKKETTEKSDYVSDMLVNGHGENLTFIFEDKKITYKLCLKETFTEVHDNEEKIEEEYEANNEGFQEENNNENNENNEGKIEENNGENDIQLPEPKTNEALKGGNKQKKRSKKLTKKRMTQAIVDI
jgi:hypothetical protein